MADLRTALREYLLADATLSAILTGGIYDAQTTDAEGADTSWIPRDPVNGVTLAPFAIIRFRGETPTEVIARTERRFVEIYFYQGYGYTQIERAKRRVKEILHRQQVQAEDAGIAMFHFVQGRGEMPAPEYENAASDMNRYYVDYVRKPV